MEKVLKSPILARAKNSRFKSATAYSVNNVIWKERARHITQEEIE